VLEDITEKCEQPDKEQNYRVLADYPLCVWFKVCHANCHDVESKYRP